MSRLLSLPWKAHGLLAAMFPLMLAAPTCLRFGVAPDGFASAERFMSAGWFVGAWIMVVPLILVETNAVGRGSREDSLASAVVAHAVLSFVGTLPITLTWVLAGFGTHPGGYDSVRVSIATYTVLIVGYFVALVLIGEWIGRHRGSSKRAHRAED